MIFRDIFCINSIVFIKGKSKTVHRLHGLLTQLFSWCVPHWCYSFEIQQLPFGKSDSMASVGTFTMKAIIHPNNYLSVSSLSRSAGRLSQGLKSLWCRPYPHRRGTTPSGNRLCQQPVIQSEGEPGEDYNHLVNFDLQQNLLSPLMPWKASIFSTAPRLCSLLLSSTTAKAAALQLLDGIPWHVTASSISEKRSKEIFRRYIQKLTKQRTFFPPLSRMFHLLSHLNGAQSKTEITQIR